MPRITKDKETVSFVSLRDFLLIQCESTHDNVDEYRTGHEWLSLYENAKKQHKLYGQELATGTHVVTTRAGFGGPRGSLKVVSEIEEHAGVEYYVIEPGDSQQENLSYMVDKKHWWAYLLVVPTETNNKKEKNVFRKRVSIL